MSITGKQVADAMGGGSIVGNSQFAALLNANFVQTPGTALRVVGGTSALDGSNPTPVATGLTTVTAFVALLGSAVAPGLNTSELTYAISGGTVNVYAWKPTSATDPTLIASTGTDAFSWIALGS